MISKYTLKNGPSREQLFDCVRLGSTTPELRVIDFWGEHKDEKGKWGALLPIEIEGIHRASNDGRDWFFWGRRKQITSGDKWVPVWESKYVDFAFGRWNTYHRTGFIKFADTSFFTNPVQDEEESVTSRIRRVDSNCALGDLPPGRYETTFTNKRDPERSAQLELQPYDGKLRVRWLGGQRVESDTGMLEKHRWTFLSGDSSKPVEELLYEKLKFLD